MSELQKQAKEVAGPSPRVLQAREYSKALDTARNKLHTAGSGLIVSSGVGIDDPDTMYIRIGHFACSDENRLALEKSVRLLFPDNFVVKFHIDSVNKLY